MADDMARNHEQSVGKGLVRTFIPGDGNGSSALWSCRNYRILASMGLPRSLFRRLPSNPAVSHASRPGVAGAPHERRAAEKENAQRSILLFASLGFIGLLVVPALDVSVSSLLGHTLLCAIPCTLA